MSEKTCYWKNRDGTVNRAQNYYKNDKERLREKARDKYINLSEEKKKKKKEYGRNIYHNIIICLKKRKKD